MIPGSEKLVFNRLERTKMKRTAPTTGMTGEIRSVGKGFIFVFVFVIVFEFVFVFVFDPTCEEGAIKGKEEA